MSHPESFNSSIDPNLKKYTLLFIALLAKVASFPCSFPFSWKVASFPCSPACLSIADAHGRYILMFRSRISSSVWPWAQLQAYPSILNPTVQETWGNNYMKTRPLRRDWRQCDVISQNVFVQRGSFNWHLYDDRQTFNRGFIVDFPEGSKSGRKAMKAMKDLRHTYISKQMPNLTILPWFNMAAFLFRYVQQARRGLSKSKIQIY